MKRPLVATAVAVTLVAQTNVGAQKPEPSIIGTWRLVAIEGIGRGTARDDRPSGIITYDNTGHMAVQIAYQAARRNPGSESTDNDKAQLFETYGAYFGTYEVDARRGMVRHHIEGSLSPSDVGMNFVRYYEIRGNQVTYYVAENGRGGLYPRKEDTVRRVVWERLSPK
jgi:lipocalin-like protein